MRDSLLALIVAQPTKPRKSINPIHENMTIIGNTRTEANYPSQGLQPSVRLDKESKHHLLHDDHRHPRYRHHQTIPSILITIKQFRHRPTMESKVLTFRYPGPLKVRLCHVWPGPHLPSLRCELLCRPTRSQGLQITFHSRSIFMGLLHEFISACFSKQRRHNPHCQSPIKQQPPIKKNAKKQSGAAFFL